MSLKDSICISGRLTPRRQLPLTAGFFTRLFWLKSIIGWKYDVVRVEPGWLWRGSISFAAHLELSMKFPKMPFPPENKNPAGFIGEQGFLKTSL
jgi:hypothetical protein